MGTESSNPAKNYNRQILVQLIKSTIKEPVVMFDFLGDGIGADFWRKELDIEKLILLDYNNDKIEKYVKNNNFYFTLFSNIYSNKKDIKDTDTLLLRYKASEYFSNIGTHPRFNVLNLDFCGMYTEEDKKQEDPKQIINTIFQRQILKNNGLLIGTFLLEGRATDIWKCKKPIQDINLIKKSIIIIAENNGYKLKEDLFGNVYTSKGNGRKNVMCNLMLQFELKDSK